MIVVIIWIYDNINIMMTSSNGDIFCVPCPLWGKFTGHRWIPFTEASDAELWFFFYLRLNKRLNKQSRRWWFKMPSHPFWRHCNVKIQPYVSDLKRKQPNVGGIELVSLSCNRAFISTESVGRGWHKIAIASDKYGCLFMSVIIDKYTLRH